MRQSVLVALIGCVCTQGCTSFNFDYVAPNSGDVATVSVRSTWDGNNQRVIFHGSNPCNASEAKLVGLINAGAVGQTNVKQIDVLVPAGSEVKMSLPQIDLKALSADSATFRYCQPVIAFVPVSGQSYVLEFGSCRADLYKTSPLNGGKPEPAPSRSDRSCAVTTTNKGTDAKLFYLAENPPQ